MLILGSVGELPHGHAAADTGLHQPHAAQVFPSGTVSEDDATCPVCVLQRLSSQAATASFSSLEKPDPTGSIAPSPSPRVADCVSGSGSPRGPPPSA